MDCQSIYAQIQFYSLRYRYATIEAALSVPLRLLSTKAMIELRLLLLLGATLHKTIEWVRACWTLRLISLHALHVHTTIHAHAHASHGLLAHLHRHRLEASWLLLLLLLHWLLLLLHKSTEGVHAGQILLCLESILLSLRLRRLRILLLRVEAVEEVHLAVGLELLLLRLLRWRIVRYHREDIVERIVL